jgi:sugar phosphate isomerase/epimerase
VTDLIASWWTIAGATPGNPARWPLEDRIAAAAKAGFDGVGLRNDDYTRWLERSKTDADLRAVLEAHGQRVDEIEFVVGWASEDEAAQARGKVVEAQLYALADAVGSRQMNVGCIEDIGALAPIEGVIERFGAMCDRAASHGLVVGLEFMPWTGVPDAAMAWEIVRRCERPNAGVLVDTWHHFRGPGDPAQLRAIPADRISGIQVNDAAREVVGTLREDTLHRRRLPGEGTFDLDGFVRLMDEMKVGVPFAIEVISDDLSALPVEVAAQRAFETTKAMLDKAR